MPWKPWFQIGTLATEEGELRVLARDRDFERGRNIYERIPRQIAINTTPSSLRTLELADVADFTAGERFSPFVTTSVDLGEEVDAP